MPAIQVKNVPDDLHDQLRRRAAEKGLTIGEYVLEAVRKELRNQELDDWLDRVAGDPPVVGLTTEDNLAALDAGREEREQELTRRARRR